MRANWPYPGYGSSASKLDAAAAPAFQLDASKLTLDFCMWLQRNFDRLVREAAKEKQ